MKTKLENIEVKEKILEKEIFQMLNNPNPLTGIYSIYGDYPIEKWNKEKKIQKDLIKMKAVR
ncbi:MAG: hypothetical protein HY754_14430 [Nitrospirae bacterium]|nr:hypothetical protein [Nitrospirota bacterium]